MVKGVVVIGAGGHCRVVLSVLHYFKEYQIVGIADRDDRHFGEEISGYTIKYTWDDLEEIYQTGINHAVIAIGDNRERRKKWTELIEIGFEVPTIIHPSALIEKDSSIGDANTICMGARIGTMVSIGQNCIIYTGTTIDHETTISDNVFIAPGCTIAGRVNIGRDSYIGAGSIIIEKIRIGQGATVGAGSVILRDVSDNDKVAGVPAKSIKTIS